METNEFVVCDGCGKRVQRLGKFSAPKHDMEPHECKHLCGKSTRSGCACRIKVRTEQKCPIHSTKATVYDIHGQVVNELWR